MDGKKRRTGPATCVAPPCPPETPFPADPPAPFLGFPDSFARLPLSPGPPPHPAFLFLPPPSLHPSPSSAEWASEHPHASPLAAASASPAPRPGPASSAPFDPRPHVCVGSPHKRGGVRYPIPIPLDTLTISPPRSSPPTFHPSSLSVRLMCSLRSSRAPRPHRPCPVPPAL